MPNAFQRKIQHQISSANASVLNTLPQQTLIIENTAFYRDRHCLKSHDARNSGLHSHRDLGNLRWEFSHQYSSCVFSIVETASHKNRNTTPNTDSTARQDGPLISFNSKTAIYSISNVRKLRLFIHICTARCICSVKPYVRALTIPMN